MPTPTTQSAVGAGGRGRAPSLVLAPDPPPRTPYGPSEGPRRRASKGAQTGPQAVDETGIQGKERSDGRPQRQQDPRQPQGRRRGRVPSQPPLPLLRQARGRRGIPRDRRQLPRDRRR